MACDFCGALGHWRNILRDSQIVKKDGSNIILCDNCMNDYTNGDFDKIKEIAEYNYDVILENKVFIERVAPLTSEGIRAVCGTKEKYKKYTKDLLSENKETKIPTHKEFQEAIDKSGLRGYEFKESSEVKR